MSEADRSKKELHTVAPFLSTVLHSRCPRCGKGALYEGYLKIRPSCPECGLSFDAFNTGDGPAVLVMFPVGFLVVGLALWVEVNYQPDYWVHAALWLPLALGLSLGLLPLFKTALSYIQYKHQAEEGRLAPK